MGTEKRDAVSKFRTEMWEKLNRLDTLQYPSAEWTALWEEMQRDEKTLSELCREATLEWLEEKGIRER